MIIYKTTNLINGKFYVGQDYNNDLLYLGSGTILIRAIKKYGRKNFKKEILETCETSQELNEREVYWIAKLDARNSSIGYNLAVGGEGSRGYTYHHSEEAKQKIRKSKSVVTEETRQKMSNAHKGKKHPISEEVLKKRAEKREKRIQEQIENRRLKDLLKYSPEAVEKRSKTQKGLKRSEETCKRISEANKRRKGNGIYDPLTKRITYPPNL